MMYVQTLDDSGDLEFRSQIRVYLFASFDLDSAGHYAWAVMNPMLLFRD